MEVIPKKGRHFMLKTLVSLVVPQPKIPILNCFYHSLWFYCF